jgi:hypothetical protein
MVIRPWTRRTFQMVFGDLNRKSAAGLNASSALFYFVDLFD